MLRGLTPKQKFMVNIGGAQKQVLLPNAAIETKLREASERSRIFLQLELDGRRIPVYLSSSRKDFRLAFIALEHNNREIGDLFRTDPAAAIKKGRLALAENPKPFWIIKFDDKETRTTRLHDALQQLLQERLPQLKIIRVSPEEFARLWHSKGFTVPDPTFASRINTLEAESLLRDILMYRLAPDKVFLHSKTK